MLWRRRHSDGGRSSSCPNSGTRTSSRYVLNLPFLFAKKLTWILALYAPFLTFALLLQLVAIMIGDPVENQPKRKYVYHFYPKMSSEFYVFFLSWPLSIRFKFLYFSKIQIQANKSLYNIMLYNVLFFKLLSFASFITVFFFSTFWPSPSLCLEMVFASTNLLALNLC